MISLTGKTHFVSGASRGIGLAIAFTDRFDVDEDLLREHNQADFSMDAPAGAEPIPDVFL